MIELIRNNVQQEEEQEANNASSETKQIEDIMEFKQHVMTICNQCFQKNKAIINSSRLELQRSFSKVDEFPKKLAIFIDIFILKNGKNIENEDVIKELNEIFDMISLTTERDRFLYYYEQALSKHTLPKRAGYFRSITTTKASRTSS